MYSNINSYKENYDTNVHKENIYITLVQGNKVSNIYHEEKYFGIHYAHYNSFKIIDHITNNTYITNKGEFLLSKKANNYSIESLGNDYTSVITLLIERSYLSFINADYIAKNTLLDTFIKNSNIPYFITNFNNIPKLEKINLEETLILFTEKNTACTLTNQIFLESLIKKIFSHINIYCITNKLDESYLLFSIKKYIRENLATATLANTAEYLNYDSSYISNYVKKETGQKFSDLLVNFRMNKAIELLNNNNNSLSEICKLTGYAKTSSFIRVFKNKYKVTPGEYKNNLTILN